MIRNLIRRSCYSSILIAALLLHGLAYAETDDEISQSRIGEIDAILSKGLQGDSIDRLFLYLGLGPGFDVREKSLSAILEIKGRDPEIKKRLFSMFENKETSVDALGYVLEGLRKYSRLLTKEEIDKILADDKGFYNRLSVVCESAAIDLVYVQSILRRYGIADSNDRQLLIYFCKNLFEARREDKKFIADTRPTVREFLLLAGQDTIKENPGPLQAVIGVMEALGFKEVDRVLISQLTKLKVNGRQGKISDKVATICVLALNRRHDLKLEYKEDGQMDSKVNHAAIVKAISWWESLSREEKSAEHVPIEKTGK